MRTCKGKDKKPTDKQWKENAQMHMKEHKVSKHDRHGKQTSEEANKQIKGKQARSKQKVVSVRDKCRFGSDVHNFIVLKYGQHNSKQDACMDM